MFQALKSKSKRIATTLAAGVLLFSQFAVVPTVGATDSNHVDYWCSVYDGGVKFEGSGTKPNDNVVDDTIDGITATYSPAGDNSVEKKSVTITDDGTKDVTLVVVKGGNDDNGGNAVYDDEPFTGLTAPVNPNNDKPFGISHVIVCYDEEEEEEETGNLTVIKDVVNDGEGEKTYADFSFTTSDGGTVYNFDADATDTNDEDGVKTFTGLPAGSSFDVTELEANTGGYATTYSGDCSGTIVADQTKVCTITNDDSVTQLTVIKHVITDNGGNAEADDFTMLVDGTNVSDGDFPGSESGTTVTLNSGSYSVNETGGPSGYTASFSEDCSGTIAVGEHKTCTITNDDNAPALTVTKDAHPNSFQPFNFTLEKLVFGEGWEEVSNFWLNDNNINLWLDDSKTFDDLSKGFYKVTEAETEGWYLTGVHCSGTHEYVDLSNRSVYVLLKLGDEVNCEFENSKYGMIWGAKFEDLNKNGEWNWGEPFLENWTITLDKWFDGQPAFETQTNEHGFYKFKDLKPGKYTVCEVQQAGWVQTKPDTESGCKIVHLGVGDVEYVKFGNFKLGSVNGVKFNDANGNGVRDNGETTLKDWTITLTKKCTADEEVVRLLDVQTDEYQEECEDVTVTTKTDANGAFVFGDLDQGTYVVCEVQQANWTQTAPKTDDGCVEFTVETSGHEEVVDFGNKAKPQVLGETTTKELVKTGASTAISMFAGLSILSVLGALHFLARRKHYSN